MSTRIKLIYTMTAWLCCQNSAKSYLKDQSLHLHSFPKTLAKWLSDLKSPTFSNLANVTILSSNSKYMPKYPSSSPVLVVQSFNPRPQNSPAWYNYQTSAQSILKSSSSFIHFHFRKRLQSDFPTIKAPCFQIQQISHKYFNIEAIHAKESSAIS